MEGVTTLSPEEKAAARRAKHAANERARRARKKAEQEAADRAAKARASSNGRASGSDPEADAIAAAAKRLTPAIKAPYFARAVRALEAIVGDEDPIEFAFAPLEGEPEREAVVPKRRATRATLLAWAQNDLEPQDLAGRHLRAMAIRVKKDPRTPLVSGRPDLWGRKVGAILVALADARKQG